MKTVYDHFVEHYGHLAASAALSPAVERGISAYLTAAGLMDVDEDESMQQRIAQRELARFRLMPLQTFTAFFETFEAREQIEQLLRECRGLAMERLRFDKTISEALYREKINAFYERAAVFAADSRYTGWLNEKTEEVSLLLKYAAGASEVLPASVLEALKLMKQDEEDR